MLPLPTRACVADPGVRIGAAMPSDGDCRNTGLTGRVASAAPMFIATGTQGPYKLLPAQDRNPLHAGVLPDRGSPSWRCACIRLEQFAFLRCFSRQSEYG